MKSSIKIDYERYENDPVIKITIPKSSKTLTQSITHSPTSNDEEDVRDKLVKDFLHSPMKVERNFLFELKTYFSTDEADIATLGAVKYENIMYKLRHTVLSRLVSYNDIVLFNSALSEPNQVYKKVHEFFDWVDILEKWENQKEPLISQ